MWSRRWSSVLRGPHTPASYRLPPTISQLLAENGGPTSGPTPVTTTTTVCGWIKSIRKQKNVSFAVVTDGSSTQGLQAVILKDRGKTDEDSIIRRLTNGAAVSLTGKLVESPGSGQSHELVVDEDAIVLLGECDPETYPIQKKTHSNEYLRDNAHFRARTSQIAAMLRLRHNLTHRIGTYFSSQGFTSVNTPILTGNDAEGAGEAFRIAPTIVPYHPPPPSEFFSRPAFLTVSHQLHLEALATALSRVYTLSPCFRAEHSDTRRHLAEFWMLEAEWAFGGDDGREDSDLQCLWDGKENRDAPIEALQNSFSQKDWWTRMTYTDAIRELSSAAAAASASASGTGRRIPLFEYAPRWGRALQSEHEKWLAETLVGGPVFVTDYPKDLKPFYMRANEDGQTVACFDLLVPHVGELAGGSVREERGEILSASMRKAGLCGDGAYGWYEELRRYGGAPHAGFGMGFERLVSWVGGIENVRECVPVPRWAGRLLL